jgi:AraC family ethanolamine operon transcriptional activator
VPFTSSQHHHGMIVGLPEELIVEALGQRIPGAEGLIRPASLQAVMSAGPQVAAIRAFADALLFRIGGPDISGMSAFAYGDFVDTLVGALTLAWQRESALHRRTASYQHLPIVHRVEAFMRAHLAEPIQLHHLCVAARASERALEYAFRDVYGVGAKQYLKLLRLNEVRRQLKRLPPDAATVADIAHRHGFWHMGRFSSGYHRLFGETPGQTLGLQLG